MSNPKATWPVVKFVLTAMGEGWTKKEARQLLDEIDPAHYTELMLRARRWNQEMSTRALDDLTTVIGKEHFNTITEMVQRAKIPSHIQERQKKERRIRKAAR